METDPGASLDRLIAALRQYQAASAADEVSPAALAAKRQLTQAFADCEQALVDPAEISKAFDTVEQVEQKARKSSGAESDTPKRVSHKKTAADGPEPVPYFNDGTNTSAFICLVYVSWIGFFYFCGLMVYNEVFERTNSFEALDTEPQWWLLALIRVAEFGLLGGSMLLLTFICGFIVREIRPHFAYPLVALVAMLLAWLTFDYEGNQRLLEDISYELIRFSIVERGSIAGYFAPQLISPLVLALLSALGALIGLWLRRRYDSIDHPMSKLVAGLKSVFSLHG